MIAELLVCWLDPDYDRTSASDGQLLLPHRAGQPGRAPARGWTGAAGMG
jgi:hypothetical protein